jgi:uncharacterized membrane protein YobD (UPF0266 family)
MYMKAALVVISLYFIRNEVTQFKQLGMSYFNSFWNYIDIMPPVFITLLVFIDLIQLNFTLT